MMKWIERLYLVICGIVILGITVYASSTSFQIMR